MQTDIKDNPILRVLMWLKGFPKRHKIITALAVLYLAWLAIMTPIKNPFASDAITVRGRFPFDQGFELVFLQETHSTSTFQLSKILCGKSYTRCNGGAVKFYPKKIDGHHYELTVFRDAYFAGLLGWVSEDRLYYRPHQSGVDPEKIAKLFLNLGPSPENYACDPKYTQTFKGGLFCSGQETHKDYKVLILPKRSDLGNNEQEYNFWLDSELDAKLKEIKP